MSTALCLSIGLSFFLGAEPPAKKAFETDVIKTAKGDITLTFIGHGTLMLQFGGNFPMKWGDPDVVELECIDRENAVKIELRRMRE